MRPLRFAIRSRIFTSGLLAGWIASGSMVFGQAPAAQNASPAAASAPTTHELAPGDLLRVINAGAALHKRDMSLAHLAKGTRIEISKIRPGWIGGYALVGDQRVPGWVQSTDLGPTPTEEEIEAAITQLTNLGIQIEKKANGLCQKASGEDARITDEDLELFQPLVDLEEIDLSGSAITGAGLGQLATLTGLERLHLDNTAVDDAGLKEVSKMTGLTGLSLSETKITDQGLEQLKQLKRLKVLNLGDTEITDQGLAHLAELKGVETLTLSRTKITGTGFTHLQDFQDLITLNLDGCPLAADTLKNFSKLTKIRILRMHHTTAPQEDIDALEEAVDGLAIFN